ncbi:MAG: hypothetical protein K0B06_00365 [Brevefilum sp.]|nr:hypothetical protein [Brevefilum sp.]
MDNYDENKNNPNEKPEGEPEEIPYWLQGFDDDFQEKTTPIESDSNDDGMWINESDNAPTDEDVIPDLEDPDESSYPQTDIMDELEADDSDESEHEIEIEEISEEASTIANNSTDAWNDREITDEIEIDTSPGEAEAELIEPDLDEPPSPEGFVDISDLDLPEPPQLENDVVFDVEAKEGELPEWLQEMISEPEEIEIKDTEMTQGSEEEEDDDDGEEEKEEEEEIKERIDALDVNWEKEHLPDEITEEDHERDEDIFEMDSTEVHEDLDAVMTISDEDTTPVSTLKTEEILPEDEEPEPIEIEGDEQEIEVREISEVDDPLDELKSYLDQGEIHQALKIINDLDEETTDIKEITPLLREAAEIHAQENSEVWEAIGDLALEHDKPQDALEAYTKAIKLLIESSEVNHEIN